MKKTVVFTLSFLVLMWSATLVFAQQESAASQDLQPYKNQKPFTASELNKFMRDWPAFTAWMESRNLQVGQIEKMGDVKQVFAMQNVAGYLKSKGWTPDRFGYVMIESVLCLAGIEFEEQGPKVDAQMQAAIEQIKSNPSFSEDQKKQMIQMMESSRQQAHQLSTNHLPQSEVALVKQHRDELKAMLDTGGE